MSLAPGGSARQCASAVHKMHAGTINRTGYSCRNPAPPPSSCLLYHTISEVALLGQPGWCYNLTHAAHTAEPVRVCMRVLRGWAYNVRMLASWRCGPGSGHHHAATQA